MGKHAVIGFICLMAHILSACASPTAAPPTPASPTPQPTALPTSPSLPSPTSPPAPSFSSPTLRVTPAATDAVRRPTASDPQIDAGRARSDLAQRLNIGADAIEVVSVSREPVPIDNLRCGDQGKSIPTVTIPGLVNATEIILRVGDKQYTYYVRGPQLIACP